MVAQDVSVLGGCISVDLHGHLISFFFILADNLTV